MKFIVDEQLPISLARWLRDRGHEAHQVTELDMRGHTDAAIVRTAERTGAVIVTKDSDFSHRRAGQMHQVVWLRVPNLVGKTLVAYWATRWEAIRAALEEGELLVEVR